MKVLFIYYDANKRGYVSVYDKDHEEALETLANWVSMDLDVLRECFKDGDNELTAHTGDYGSVYIGDLKKHEE